MALGRLCSRSPGFGALHPASKLSWRARCTAKNTLKIKSANIGNHGNTTNKNNDSNSASTYKNEDSTNPLKRKAMIGLSSFEELWLSDKALRFRGAHHMSKGNLAVT